MALQSFSIPVIDDKLTSVLEPGITRITLHPAHLTISRNCRIEELNPETFEKEEVLYDSVCSIMKTSLGAVTQYYNNQRERYCVSIDSMYYVHPFVFENIEDAGEFYHIILQWLLKNSWA